MVRPRFDKSFKKWKSQERFSSPNSSCSVFTTWRELLSTLSNGIRTARSSSGSCRACRPTPRYEDSSSSRLCRLKSCQMFPVTGVTVAPAGSDHHSLSLYEISREAGGRYRCEVSTEAPHFYTAVESVTVTVWALPRGPLLSGLKSSYSLEENISLNCSTFNSLPAPTISWYVNGDNTDPSNVIVLNLHNSHTANGLIDSSSSLKLTNLGKYCKGDCWLT